MGVGSQGRRGWRWGRGCKGRGFTEGAWLGQHTRGRGFRGRGWRWGVASEGKAWLQRAWPYRGVWLQGGVASGGVGASKGGAGDGAWLQKERRGFKGRGFTEGAWLGQLTRGRGCREGVASRGGGASKGGATRRRSGLDSTPWGMASWGRGHRVGGASGAGASKGRSSGAGLHRGGVASRGRGYKRGGAVGWGVASGGVASGGAWLHGGGGVSGHAPSRPDPHLGSTDPIELVPAPWIWGEPPWPWI